MSQKQRFLSVLPTIWRRKTTGIDTEQNGVTVALCTVCEIRAKSRSNWDRLLGGSVAEWLARWTQAQKGPGSNRSRDAVG